MNFIKQNNDNYSTLIILFNETLTVDKRRRSGNIEESNYKFLSSTDLKEDYHDCIRTTYITTAKLHMEYFSF